MTALVEAVPQRLVAQQYGRSSVRGASYNPQGPPKLCSNALFDADKHLCFREPEERITMSEIGYPGLGIDELAVTRPFDLFTPEAVEELRADVLSTKVLNEYTVPSQNCAFQAREFSRKVAPFVFQAYYSKEVQQAVSAAAGIELIPIMDLEIGHVNYQLGPEGVAGVYALGRKPSPPLPPITMSDRPDATADTTVGWHYDSYAFVTVTMLSDMTNVIGGETCIEKADKSVLRVEGCKIGQTYVMQGAYCRHLAAKAYNASERISMVTSWRPKNPMLYDPTNMDGIFCMSTRARLNSQVATYRLKLAAERLQAYADKIAKDRGEDDQADLDVIEPTDLVKFFNEQYKYLMDSLKQMIP